MVTDNLAIRDWDDPFKTNQPYNGIERRVLSFTDELMLVHYTVAEGAVFPEHSHDETHQAVYVIDGAIELFGEQSATLEAGDTFVVGPNVRHGIRGLAEETTLVDAFTPPIKAYAES